MGEQGTWDEMMAMVHDLRAKIMTNPTYKEGKIIGAILFEDTINRDVEGIPTTQYLWEKKKVVPFVKSDVGLAPPADGVQMMKDHPGLEDMLDRGLAKGIRGTKQRSQIQAANPEGIKKLVAQQFESSKRLAANEGMIASFSRTLREGLHVSQTDEEFTKTLGDTLDKVVKASST